MARNLLDVIRLLSKVVPRKGRIEPLRICPDGLPAASTYSTCTAGIARDSGE